MGKFSLGNLVCTRGVANRCAMDAHFAQKVEESILRHAVCDWGDLCDEDKQVNKEALQEGGRLLSAYYIDDAKAEKIWIITEWDRSVTTVLFPDEY
jgi:hypothetical protein